MELASKSYQNCARMKACGEIVVLHIKNESKSQSYRKKIHIQKLQRMQIK
jgi:hypothetical protein